MILRAAFVPPEEAVEELRAISGRIGMLPGVHAAPTDRLDLPIAGLGNLSAKDAVRLADNFEAWQGVDVLPEVHWSGIRLEPNGEVVVGVGGDLDGLAEVARAVGKCAERVHVYVDRRAYRPVAVIATMDPQQPGSRVASALSGLDDWVGVSWTAVDVALLRIRWFGGEPVSEVVEWIPIPTRAEAEAEAEGNGTPVVEPAETR